METIGINGCIVPIAKSPLDSARGRKVSRGLIHNHSKKTNRITKTQSDADLEEFYDFINMIGVISSIQTPRSSSNKGSAHK